LVIVLVAVIIIAGVGAYWFMRPKPTPTPEEGEPIIIGVAIDTNGENGKGVIKAIELGAKEVNEQGGVVINGVSRPLKVVAEDTKEEQPTWVASDVITAVTKLIVEDGADVIMGGWGGSGYIPDIVAEHKILYLSGSGGSIDHSKITPDNEYKYVYQGQIDVMGWGTLEALCTLYFANIYKTKQVAWLCEDAAFARVHLEVFKEILGKEGITIDPIIWFPSTKTDFSTELEAIRRSGAPVTFEVFAVANSIPFMQEWKDTEVKTFLVSLDIGGGTPGIGEETHGLYDYLVDIQGLARVPISNMTVPFFDAYTEYAGREPTLYEGNYYSFVSLYKKAVEKAQTTDSDALLPIIHNTEWASVFGKIKFNDHNFAEPGATGEEGFILIFSQWQDKKLKVVWPEIYAEVEPQYPAWHQPPS